MTALRALAPAKINLGLVVGPVRTRDRRHEIASVMQSISLADEVVLEPGAAGEDELICPGVSGPPEDNLAAASLRALLVRCREALSDFLTVRHSLESLY